MKSMFSFLGVIVVLISICLPISIVEAQEAGKVQVAAATISRDVVNREAVDIGTRFPNSVARLYCFTKIVGADPPTEIVHVWRYGDVERARISLGVKSSNWRTYSSKAIQAHETGAWRVDVLDAAGNLLESVNFEVTQ
jgi:hypothetical protein